MLITKHYIYNCIKLMHNKEVFYTMYFSAYLIFTTRQAIKLSCNTEVHLCNHCCSGKSIILHIPKVCFLALGILHWMWELHTVNCDLSGSTIFFHIILSWYDFLEGWKLLQIKCVLIFFTTFVWKISFKEELSEIWLKTYNGLQSKYPLFMYDLN